MARCEGTHHTLVTLEVSQAPMWKWLLDHPDTWTVAHTNAKDKTSENRTTITDDQFHRFYFIYFYLIWQHMIRVHLISSDSLSEQTWACASQWDRSQQALSACRHASALAAHCAACAQHSRLAAWPWRTQRQHAHAKNLTLNSLFMFKKVTMPR